MNALQFLRTPLLAAALASLTLAAFACGDDDEDGPANGTSPTPPSEEIVGVALPAAAEEYAQALCAAWMDGDDGAIRELADETASAILLERPYDGAEGWEFQNCTASSGSSFCTWKGASEDLVFELNTSETVDSGQAVIGVVFSEPAPDNGGAALPIGAEAYADAAYEAWSAGDAATLERMLEPAVLPVLQTREWLASDGWKKSGCEASAEGVFCRWEATNGDQLEMRVDEAAAEAGSERAITDVIFTGF